LENDAFSIRLFRESGLEFCVAQSFAKNFGLYGERIGAAHFVTSAPELAAKVLSQVKLFARALWSNPPIHGSAIVSTVLANPELLQQWKDELRAVSERIQEMRAALRGNIEKLGTPGDWSHITSQIGMFSYTGLSEA
jgi:aspartate aminotransferase